MNWFKTTLRKIDDIFPCYLGSMLMGIGFEETLRVSEVVKPSTKVQSGTSFTVLSAEGLDSSKSPEADPLKTALQCKMKYMN